MQHHPWRSADPGRQKAGGLRHCLLRSGMQLYGRRAGRKIRGYPADRQHLYLRYPRSAENKQEQHHHPAFPPRMDPG